MFGAQIAAKKISAPGLSQTPFVRQPFQPIKDYAPIQYQASVESLARGFRSVPYTEVAGNHYVQPGAAHTVRMVKAFLLFLD